MAFVPNHAPIRALAPGLPTMWAAHAEKFEKKADETTCEVERADFLEIARQAREKAADVQEAR